jgi:uncharacterized protein involved in cysteine biosynthesis
MERCAICGSPLRGQACSRCSGTVTRPDLLQPPPRGPVSELATGLRLAARGAALTIREPRLLALVVIPLVVNVLLFVAMVTLLWQNREVFRPDFAQPWIFGLDWLRGFAESSVQWLAVIAGIAAAFVLTVIASGVVNAPFLEWLSEAVESIVVGRGERTFRVGDVWRMTILPIFQALGVAIVQTAFAAIFFMLSFIPFLTPLTVIGGVWLVAVTLCDVAISRKGYPARERFRRVKRQLPLYLGLALPFFVAPFLLPLGVAGATLADLRQRLRCDNSSR